MISTRQAMAMLGVSRKLFDKIKCDLHQYQYMQGGKLFYKRSDIEAYIERKRKPVYVHGLVNKEIANWF